MRSYNSKESESMTNNFAFKDRFNQLLRISFYFGYKVPHPRVKNVIKYKNILSSFSNLKNLYIRSMSSMIVKVVVNY